MGWFSKLLVVGVIVLAVAVILQWRDTVDIEGQADSDKQIYSCKSQCKGPGGGGVFGTFFRTCTLLGSRVVGSLVGQPTLHEKWTGPRDYIGSR